jgi:4-amino-4-deoxy-L-arabinose transferase-like glycosyltransferase
MPDKDLKAQERTASVSGSVSVSEWIVVCILIAVGVAARIAWPENMAVEHFDEGVYASNLWFDASEGYHYPLRYFYAPPLLPSLIEFAQIADLTFFPASALHDSAPMWPALLFGSATLILVWQSMRFWFGPESAISAVGLVALSDFHVFYSRTALTDVLLVFFLLLASWLLQRGMTSRGWGLLVVAGLATALGWWTKYNGWLPLAIAGTAAFVQWMVTREGKHFVALAGRWSVAAIVAVFAWSPLVWSLQNTGGYAAVAANHRNYVVGISGWFESLRQQIDNLVWWDSWMSVVGIVAAVLAPGLLRYGQSRWPIRIAIAAALAAILAWTGTAFTLFAVGCVGLASSMFGLRDELRTSPARVSPRLMISVWFVAMFVATPLYHPYPRLLLPWLCAAWLTSSIGIEWVTTSLARHSTKATSAVATVVMVLALAGLGLRASQLQVRGVPAWQPRDGLANIGSRIAEWTYAKPERLETGDAAAIFFVYGEPGLFYHLRSHGLNLSVPIVDLDLAASLPADAPPAYLVTGPHADQTPAFQQEWQRYDHDFEQVQEYRYRPSDLVVLNQHTPAALQSPSARPEYEIRVFRIVSSLGD